ncbi:alanine racemase [Paraburkholderia tropica]|uniref:alanine racemase n=1 Tax=Paraburkholderia tropica TaxID=92647 RepID=UPI002AB142EC|nr:alanine racemase [Paraburkholderia tropica]
MPRPISAHIHLDAIHHNLATIKGKAAHSRVWAVVKANAYGHGIERIFPALSDADGIALLDLEEAVRVRQLGWVKPILLLEGVFQPADLAVASENSLTFSLHCEDQVRMLRHADRSARFDIQLKMNTGMNRLGFRPDVFRKVWEEVSGLPAVRSVGLMSHFATADEGDIDWQLDVFEAATAGIPGERTLSNSAAVLWHPSAHRDWVRPGIVLYGGSPTGSYRHIESQGLLAAMSLHSQLIGVQHLREGETVGYSRTFTAGGQMTIGVVACGYADGYPRHASTGTPILVDGVRTRVVGRVSMDMLTVDLTPCPHATIGAPVELWGNHVRIDEVAEAGGTIGYELMCALAPRVPVTTMALHHEQLEGAALTV